MVSYNKRGVCKEGRWPVLILIVMDNGLLRFTVAGKAKAKGVLILIVMDNGLLLCHSWTKVAMPLAS